MPQPKPLALSAALLLVACTQSRPVKLTPAPGASPPAAPASASAGAEAPAEEPPAPVAPGRCIGTFPEREKPASPQNLCCYPDKEGIRRIISKQFPAMQRCYESALRRADPGLSGRVVVKFTIERDGTVLGACDAGSEITEPAMIDCLLKTWLELRFPSEEGSVCPLMTITYPIVFHP